MDLQIVLPDESPSMNPQRIIDLGVAAEQRGYHTACLPDHLLPPAAYGPTYGGAFEPRPQHHLPIMVGGMSDRALRRATTLADEWQGMGLEPTEFADAVHHIRQQAKREMRVGTRIAWSGGEAELTRVVDQARRFRDVGADALAVSLGTEDGIEERLSTFADRVRA